MLHRSAFLPSMVLLPLAAACTSATGASDAGASCASPGGPAAGASDTHCGTKVQATSPAGCYPDASSGDAGMSMSNPYGATLYGAEGDDDDCKYHLAWSATPVCEDADVTFEVTAKRKTDGSPLTGAAPRAEVYLNDKHPAPATAQKPDETAPGVYRVGPIRFDAPGRWTVRFHLFQLCDDMTDDSPHGHGAFYVEVP